MPSRPTFSAYHEADYDDSSCAWCGQDLGYADTEQGTPRWDGFCCKECEDMDRTTGGAKWRRLAHGDKWVQFTKRTEDPKLSWLEAQLSFAGIAHRRAGASAHAPILEVAQSREADAWEILGPVDDMRDDLPRFRSTYAQPYMPHYAPSPATKRVVKRTIKGISAMMKKGIRG